MRDFCFPDQRAHACQAFDAVWELGEVRFDIVNHLQNELPDKVRVARKHDVEQKVVHLQQAELGCARRHVCDVFLGSGF